MQFRKKKDGATKRIAKRIIRIGLDVSVNYGMSSGKIEIVEPVEGPIDFGGIILRTGRRCIPVCNQY
jgi:hypothetical protein